MPIPMRHATGDIRSSPRYKDSGIRHTDPLEHRIGGRGRTRGEGMAVRPASSKKQDTKRLRGFFKWILLWEPGEFEAGEAQGQ